MRRALLISVFCCVCVWPATAQAVTLVNTDGSVAQPYQDWADAARVPTPDIRLAIIPRTNGVCGDDSVIACVVPGGIAFSGRPDSGVIDWRHVLYHELGHHFDYLMPEWKRRVFRKIVGLDMPWRVWPSHSELSYSEYFADAYAMLAASSVRTRTQRRFERLIRQPN